MKAAYQNISALQALKRLVLGNERYREGNSHPDQFSLSRSTELTKGQNPFATILGCSDARVPPEIIFDADQGELFVIRVAGNVFLPAVAGSLRYAGCHLHTPLVVVLGHEGCGAVSAALAARERGAADTSRNEILAQAILPGLPEFSGQSSAEARLSEAVKSNVLWTRKQILQSPEGRIRIEESSMRIISAIYDIATGRVKFTD